MPDDTAHTDSSLSRPLRAALEAFVEHGYGATTVRDIAKRAGISVPGLYHHYSSKQSMLVELMTIAIEDLLNEVHGAIAEAGPSPSSQFDLIVERLLRYHANRRYIAFLSTSELRGLELESRDRVVSRRKALQRLVNDVIRTGVDQGVFETRYPDDAGRAVVAVCTGLSQWYRPDGALSVDEIVSRYLEISREIVRTTERHERAASHIGSARSRDGRSS